MEKALSEYQKKRNFKLTSEPSGHLDTGRRKGNAHALRFVIQKHDARRLHYDFRLEMDGTLKSWAIPKGPSLDPKDKRLAVHVEDHPISYGTFEGSIPHGQYGGGDVIVWDHGVWQPHGDALDTYKSGKLKFTLIGEKLTGEWALVRTHLRGSGDKEQWLLIKENDEVARPSSEYDIVSELPQSVLSGAVIKPKNAEKKTSAKPALKKVAKAPTQKVSSLKKATLPKTLSPELATLVSEPPAGEWLYEIKYDGYRILTRIQDGEVKLFTRNGHDWTDRLPLQAEAIAALNLGDSWLDGEVVVLNDAGLPDFQALQNAFDKSAAMKGKAKEKGKENESKSIHYYLFDAPFLNGFDLRSEPLELRRAALEKIIPKRAKSPLRFSSAFAHGHEDVLASACSLSLEGIIGKRAGSPYVTTRSGDWIKLKCKLRQEFVIVGYTKPQGSRSGFGALLVAVHEGIGKPELRYAGRIGTGFNESLLQELYQKLKKLERGDTPLAHGLNNLQMRGVQWVAPKLICEAEFAQWTGEGVLRQAAFVALRSDKPVKDIIREQAKSPNELNAEESPKEKLKMNSKVASVKTVSVEERSAKESSAKESSSKKSSTKKIVEKTTASSDEKKAKPKTTKSEALKGKSENSQVSITHPDRVIDPESQATKKDLAIFYAEISSWILPHLNHRPVSILRAPEGIKGEQFFQKHTEHLAIPNIKHLDKSLDPGHAALMEIDTAEALVGAVQMGTIELHTWGSTSDAIETPDRIILDLDPDPALPWRSVVEATRLTLAMLEELQLDAFLKTTGGKGMHVVIPLKPNADWEYVKEFSKTISQFMATQIPERFVAKMGPKNRVGKIFIDYLRNQRGASTVAAFSVRARDGLPVSVPIAQNELVKLTASSQWNIANLQARLSRLKKDPWEAYEHRKLITQAMWKKLDASHR